MQFYPPLFQIASNEQVILNNDQRASWFAASVSFPTNPSDTFTYKCREQVEAGTLGLVETPDGQRKLVTVVECRTPTDEDCLVAHKWLFPLAFTEEALQKTFNYDAYILEKLKEQSRKQAVSDRLKEVLNSHPLTKRVTEPDEAFLSNGIFSDKC